MDTETPVESWLVQIDETQNETLRIPLFDVNIRLFKENESYRDVIRHVMHHMEEALCESYTNYPDLKGISGANVGIPFNIVATYYHNRVEFYINPSYKKSNTEESPRRIRSNCGSLRLTNEVWIDRHATIELSYYDKEGELQEATFSGAEARTIQHEVDHNDGILITSPCRKGKIEHTVQNDPEFMFS